MGTIDGVDNHSMFIPINRDDNSPGKVNGNNIDDSIAGSPGGDSDFQSLLKSLLDKIKDNGGISADDNAQNDAAKLLSPGSGVDNTSVLLSLLSQMSQTDSSQSSHQVDNSQLNRIIAGLKKDDSQPSIDQQSDNPHSWVISKYAQAMHDFRNAFNLPVETGAPGAIQTIDMVISGEPGVNPAKQEISAYITAQCKAMGIPAGLGLATATTESDMVQFNKDGTPFRNSNPDSTDWGIMQINDKAWGDTYDFNLIKSDWQYNVRAGLQILKASFDAAAKDNEGSKGTGDTIENLARAAYSGYNAGTQNVWRYRTPIDNAPQTKLYDVLDNQGYDMRDIHFRDNYQKFSKE